MKMQQGNIKIIAAIKNNKNILSDIYEGADKPCISWNDNLNICVKELIQTFHDSPPLTEKGHHLIWCSSIIY